MSSQKNLKRSHPAKAYNSRLARGQASIRSFRTQVRGHNAAFPLMQSVAEKKNIDQAVANSALFPAFGVTTGVYTLLNGCTAGALPTNRVGRRIRMTSLLVRGNITLQATSTGSAPFRLIIFYDSQSNKLVPGATDVLATNSVNGVNQLANSRRFRIIRDIIVPCVGTAGPQTHYINEYTKLGLETEFIDGTGAGDVSDITTGSLYCLAYGNGTIGTASAGGSITFRVRFSDL